MPVKPAASVVKSGGLACKLTIPVTEFARIPTPRVGLPPNNEEGGEIGRGFARG